MNINTSDNDTMINNLINFESIYSIKIFKKTSTKMILRNITKITNDCNKIKKKKILLLSNELKLLSNGIIDIDIIKNTQNKILEDIDNLNSIISIINIINIDENDEYIEIYSN